MTLENQAAPAEDTIVFKFHQRQLLALKALLDPNVEELLYGGAKGGGKTVFGTRFLYFWAKKLIQEFHLPETTYPPVIGFMGRKQSVDFTTTTLLTWKREIPAEAYELSESKKLITIENRVAIQYGGLDDSDTIKKFNSAEFCVYFLDQAEECSEQDVAMLRGALRLKLRDGVTGEERALDYKGLLTANPAICWLKPAFITNPQPKTKFIRALPVDNPFLAPGYIERLRKAFEFKPELLRAYLEGSWEDLDAAFVVIRAKDVVKNVDNDQHDTRATKRITACDVSGEGDDETVIYDLENTKIVRDTVEIYSHRSLMDTVGRIQAHAQKNKSNLICVDKVGEGSGVYSRLCEIFATNPNMTVYGFDGRISAPEGINKQTYRNYKSFAWFRAAEKFAEKRCDIPDDQQLISQLCSVTWHYTSNEVMCLDAKDELKEKIKRSPDRADCYVMALDALDRAEPVRKIDAYSNDAKPRRLTPDAA